MKRRSLIFCAPRRVEVKDEEYSKPGPGQVTVQTIVSGISAGTEMLLYRGEAPASMKADTTIPSLAGDLHFPLKYGYSTVGRVIDLGPDVDRGFLDAAVFVFHPHESHFTAGVEELIPLPPGMKAEEGLFLPNMETAVTLVMDGRPMIGERVAGFGQGIVGLLATALLARFPLAALVTLDRCENRRRVSLELGAHRSLDPSDPKVNETLSSLFQGPGDAAGADLCYEVSGNPLALDIAISTAGFHGRVVVASWYGIKPAPLSLGGAFHRSRIRIMSSQVSTISPDLTGRWSKDRLLDTVKDMMETVRPERFITHRVDFDRAADAYDLLDRHPEEALQVILTYA